MKILRSSVDDSKLALTVKGLIVGALPIVVFVFSQFGVELELNDLLALVNSLLALAATAMTTVGILRKFYVAIAS